MILNGCVFCNKIKEGSVIPVKKTVVRFEPLNPCTPGHMLFVDKEHSDHAAQRPHITARVVKEACKYMAGLNEHSNLIINCGADAEQTVFHLHVHVVPRRKNDGLQLLWKEKG